MRNVRTFGKDRKIYILWMKMAYIALFTEEGENLPSQVSAIPCK